MKYHAVMSKLHNYYTTIVKIYLKMITHPYYVIIDQKSDNNTNQAVYLCYLYSIYNLMIREYVLAFVDYYENSYSKNV